MNEIIRKAQSSPNLKLRHAHVDGNDLCRVFDDHMASMPTINEWTRESLKSMRSRLDRWDPKKGGKGFFKRAQDAKDLMGKIIERYEELEEGRKKQVEKLLGEIESLQNKIDMQERRRQR